jgi:hypothetical protein
MAKRWRYDEDDGWQFDDLFDEHGVLKNKRSARVPMMMRDGLSDLQRSVRDATASLRVVDAFGNSGLALNKPGARYLTAGKHTSDHAALVMRDHERREARDQYIADLTSAWQRKPAATAEAHGAQEGDQCTINGQPGRLDAKLECIPDKRQDAMTMDEAQKIKDAAWLKSVQELEGAWRKPLP